MQAEIKPYELEELDEEEDRSIPADPTVKMCIRDRAKNAVEDNMPDYLAELKTLTEGSFLEELDELNLEVEYRLSLIHI